MTDIVNNSSKSAHGGEMASNPQTAATIAPEGTMTRNATVGEGSALSKELRLSNGVRS